MPSSGTKATGFALAILGPFHCANCQKKSGSNCLDKEVYRDKEIPGYAERKSDAGIINCPTTTCSHTYTDGSTHTLTATPGANTLFAGWSGDCAGTGTCTLTMTTNHTVTATFNPNLQSGVSFNPTSLIFGNVTVNTSSSPQTIVMTNSGLATLNITSIGFTGPNASDFSQTNNCGASLGAGASCNINITFTPSQVASESASLSVSDNAPGSPQTANLNGNGVSSVPTGSKVHGKHQITRGVVIR